MPEWVNSGSTQPQSSTKDVQVKTETKAEAKRPVRLTAYLNRLSLSAPTPGVEGQTARLYWAVFDGNPRIIIRTNDPNDEQNSFGKITAPIDGIICQTVADMIVLALTKEPNWKMKIENKSTYSGNQRFDTPQPINDIIVGNDSEGCVYLSVVEKERPHVRFFFAPTQWHNFYHGDGNPMSRKEISQLYAKAYSAMLPNIIAGIIAFDATKRMTDSENGKDDNGDAQTQKSSGGYQKSNWQNNRNNSGGGYQNNNWNNNRQGGGGYQKGNWQGNKGNWNNNNRGGYQQRQGGGGGYSRGNASESISDDDLNI